ncbi:MAG: hypothetical protein J5590_07915 [Clostridia bacterium]|nr:hypothetical protein [Clostridia bacterium]
MYTEKQIDDLADIVVKEAVSRYTKIGPGGFGMVMCGIGPWKVESFPGAGHNYYAIIRAIYRYYAKDKTIGSMTYDGLEWMCSTGAFMIEVDELLIKFIVAFLDAQKNNKAPFEIDAVSLLTKLKDRMTKYSVVIPEYRETYDEFLSRNGKFIEEMYGYKIL